MIEEAAAFAERAHRGVFRKGTRIPYIVHPMEAAVIVAAMTGDEEIISAALLHDVVEDTPVTAEEIGARFGGRVMSLVMAQTENKGRSWRERKAATLAALEREGHEVRLLALGDKLSNMRSTARDYLICGDRLWERFNEKDKRQHAWYYWGIAKRLKEFEGQLYYEELVMLCGRVFGEPPEEIEE